MKALAVIALLSLSACLPSQVTGTLETFDAAAEQEADTVLAFAVRRLCAAPVDVMARQVGKSRDLALGVYLICPPVRTLVDTVMQARGPMAGGGLAAPVEIAPIRLVPER